MTVSEGCNTYGGDTPGKYQRCKTCTIRESKVSNRSEALVQGYLLKIGASLESAIHDFCHPGGYVDGGQPGAFAKAVYAHLGKRGGQCDMGDRIAPEECAVDYSGYGAVAAVERYRVGNRHIALRPGVAVPQGFGSYVWLKSSWSYHSRDAGRSNTVIERRALISVTDNGVILGFQALPSEHGHR